MSAEFVIRVVYSCSEIESENTFGKIKFNQCSKQWVRDESDILGRGVWSPPPPPPPPPTPPPPN